MARFEDIIRDTREQLEALVYAFESLKLAIGEDDSYTYRAGYNDAIDVVVKTLSRAMEDYK